jgi:hypothetical protein
VLTEIAINQVSINVIVMTDLPESASPIRILDDSRTLMGFDNFLEVPLRSEVLF